MRAGVGSGERHLTNTDGRNRVQLYQVVLYCTQMSKGQNISTSFLTILRFPGLNILGENPEMYDCAKEQG